MIYVFSSSFYPLFRQNVLNASCYPDGYVMRVRYGAEYLSADLAKDNAWKELPGEDALFVFAEGALANIAAGPGGAKRDYRFLPLRRCTVVSVQMTAGIFIMDIMLAAFLDYGEKSDATREESWDEEIKAHADRPYPKGLRETEGSYVYRGPVLSVPLPGEAEKPWRSVVDRLNQSELQDCVTYHVRGFYRNSGWPLSIRRPERQVLPRVKGPDAVYRFRTGETILVKVLLYGQANASASGKAIKVDFDGRTFTSASAARIPIDSRYNEERVLLPCVRGTEKVMSALSFVPTGDDSKIWAPQPSFVVSISPQGGYLLGVAALFALAFFIANVGAFTDYTFLFNGSLRTELMGSLNKISKPIGALLFLAGTWFYLRKFPLK
ncbi:MAG TPA: hypothetical protein VIY49_39600 [Bryobacteraceae bacterium]